MDDLIEALATVIERWEKYESERDVIHSYNDPMSYTESSMHAASAGFCKDIRPLMRNLQKAMLAAAPNYLEDKANG